MDIRKGIEKIVLEKGEIFIKARDQKHAESMRVTAFNIRRRMPAELVSNVGIQAFSEDGMYFLRLFDRCIDGSEIWVRGEDGRITPAGTKELSTEIKRIIKLMVESDTSEEDILSTLSEENPELIRKEIVLLKG